MATEVIVTTEFASWYDDLSQAEQESVRRVIGILEELGPKLSFPQSSAIKGSRIALRELRIQHAGQPYRILYVFDPARQAVLLLGGNKIDTGNHWYKSAISMAERLYAEYLETWEDTK